jgi:hypothetical protein
MTVLPFLKEVYSRACGHGAHSWQVINVAMRESVETAIKARFEFDKNDFVTLAEPPQETYGYQKYGLCAFWRWVGKDTEHWYGEELYRLAVESNNLSAAKAIEAWHKRKPFIVDGQRFYVGKCFPIDQKWWTVGSFSDDGNFLNLHSEGKDRKRLTSKELKSFIKPQKAFSDA